MSCLLLKVIVNRMNSNPSQARSVSLEGGKSSAVVSLLKTKAAEGWRKSKRENH